MIFVNNCIVIKVQEFMYKKYSCVGLSTPKRNIERTEERHRLWGGEWEPQQRTEHSEEHREHDRAVLNRQPPLTPERRFSISLTLSLLEIQNAFQKTDWLKKKRGREAPLCTFTNSVRSRHLAGGLGLIRWALLTFITPEYPPSVPSLISWLEALTSVPSAVKAEGVRILTCGSAKNKPPSLPPSSSKCACCWLLRQPPTASVASQNPFTWYGKYLSQMTACVIQVHYTTSWV